MATCTQQTQEDCGNLVQNPGPRDGNEFQSALVQLLRDPTTSPSRLIRSKAKQLHRQKMLHHCDADDIAQELRLHVLAQAKHYDPARAQLSTFVSRIVHTKIAAMLRHQRANKRRANVRVVPMSRVNSEGDSLSGFANSIDQQNAKRHRCISTRAAAEEGQLVDDVELALGKLPMRLRILAQRLMVDSPSQVARDTNTSRGTIYRAMSEIRERFVASDLQFYV